MALINCNECGKQISDRADVCPFCGNPGKKTEKTPETVYIQNEKKSGGGIWVFVGVLIAIILIIIIIGSL